MGRHKLLVVSCVSACLAAAALVFVYSPAVSVLEELAGSNDACVLSAQMHRTIKNLKNMAKSETAASVAMEKESHAKSKEALKLHSQADDLQARFQAGQRAALDNIKRGTDILAQVAANVSESDKIHAQHLLSNGRKNAGKAKEGLLRAASIRAEANKLYKTADQSGAASRAAQGLAQQFMSRAHHLEAEIDSRADFKSCASVRSQNQLVGVTVGGDKAGHGGVLVAGSHGAALAAAQKQNIPRTESLYQRVFRLVTAGRRQGPGHEEFVVLPHGEDGVQQVTLSVPEEGRSELAEDPRQRPFERERSRRSWGQRHHRLREPRERLEPLHGHRFEREGSELSEERIPRRQYDREQYGEVDSNGRRFARMRHARSRWARQRLQRVPSSQGSVASREKAELRSALDRAEKKEQDGAAMVIRLRRELRAAKRFARSAKHELVSSLSSNKSAKIKRVAAGILKSSAASAKARLKKDLAAVHKARAAARKEVALARGMDGTLSRYEGQFNSERLQANQAQSLASTQARNAINTAASAKRDGLVASTLNRRAKSLELRAHKERAMAGNFRKRAKSLIGMGQKDARLALQAVRTSLKSTGGDGAASLIAQKNEKALGKAARAATRHMRTDRIKARELEAAAHRDDKEVLSLLRRAHTFSSKAPVELAQSKQYRVVASKSTQRVRQLSSGVKPQQKRLDALRKADGRIDSAKNKAVTDLAQSELVESKDRNTVQQDALAVKREERAAQQRIQDAVQDRARARSRLMAALRERDDVRKKLHGLESGLRKGHKELAQLQQEYEAVADE